MATKQQEQQPDKLQKYGKRHKKLFQRTLVIFTVIIFAIAIAIIWILSSLSIISRSWATISSIIVTVLGVVFAFLQSLHLLFPPDKQESYVASEHTPPPSLSQTLPIIVQPIHRGILGIPPPTDPRTIQQRQHIVKEVYMKLTQSGVAAIALTGIGGVGKSTLAALVYRFAEEQRSTHNAPFLSEALWLTVDPAVTFADLAGNLFEALGKPLPDLGNLAPQNQAVALFHLLDMTDKPRLIILDQFENLLDWETGRALTDRPGVGEWLEIINSQQCHCRILLTSRPRPVGTRRFPPTYMREYPITGLEVAEGVELLQNQGVKGTEKELQTAVERCTGHAFSLTLLASLIRDHSMSLTNLIKDPMLWTGDIATNLLDQIYTQQLSELQRELLLAFSVYREPVSLDATQAIITEIPKAQVLAALKVLRTQHLVEAVGEGRYQLHTIIADYAQSHFDESNELANEEELRVAHARAAQYYLQRAATTCPPREKRRRISDVHDLIEAIWQLCKAEKWQEAFDLMEQEKIFSNLRIWGGNAILLELCQLLLPVEKWLPISLQIIHLYIYLSRIYRRLGQMEQALEYCEQALSVCREAGELGEEGLAFYYLGRVHDDLGQKEKALECYQQALQIFLEIEDHGREGIVLNNLGRVYNELGRREQAREYLGQALSICRVLGNQEEENKVLNNLGLVYSNLGQKDLSLKYYEQALHICREIGDRGSEGWTLNNLGKVYASLGQMELAREHLEQALRVRSEGGHRLGTGRTLNNLGRVYSSQGHYEQALKCCEEALDISKEVDDRMGEGLIFNNLGLIYAEQGKGNNSVSFYKQALAILREVGDRGAEGRTLNNLGRVSNMLMQKENALKYYAQALKVYRDIGDQWGEGETIQNIGIFYFEKCRYDVALASFLLAGGAFGELKSPLFDETHRQIDILQKTVGDEQFTVLLAQVEPYAQQIVEQTLREELEKVE
jgi:tetratricopeptide (TPR) repeat protein